MIDPTSLITSIGVLVAAGFATMYLAPHVPPPLGGLMRTPGGRLLITLGVAVLIGVVWLGIALGTLALALAFVNLIAWFLPGGRFR